MIKELRISPLLHGYRGKDRYDTAPLVDSILLVSKLISEIPKISEIDTNPLILSHGKSGSKIVDVRIILKGYEK